MKIESLSLKSSTIAIFAMVGIAATILSLFAGAYFKQAALEAQMKSLSRVIEVASQELLKEIGFHTSDLGMKLAHSRELISTIKHSQKTGDTDHLVELLDDPFINGFAGFSDINLKKIRVYNLELELIGKSNAGLEDLGDKLDDHIATMLSERNGVERLKAIDALWMSSKGPLISTIVPLGGLHAIGYLELVVNPVFNLPDIERITNTPVRVYSMSGVQISKGGQDIAEGLLPVELTLHASDGTPAFRIVGYENIEDMNREMERTQIVTTGSFLLLELLILLFALWLFNRFLFLPVNQMLHDMSLLSRGQLDLTVNDKGLREFHIFANAFNAMTIQMRMRTNDLKRLLNLDDSALICFDHDNDAVYFNKAATSLFGYTSDEIIDLDIADFFSDDIASLILDPAKKRGSNKGNLRTLLHCKHKDGHKFQRNSIINTIRVRGETGLGVALNTTPEKDTSTLQNHQRLDAVEQTLSNLLAFAKDNPDVMLGAETPEYPDTSDTGASQQKSVLREQTPTTRTLDKYLNIDSCPKNPRSQRVIDTAEFVLREAGKFKCIKCGELREATDLCRRLLSGIKPHNT
jgi:PAS domain S-box-containing protein